MDEMEWGRGLLNGIFVWLVSLALYALPASLYAFSLSVRLGTRGSDPAVIAKEVVDRLTSVYPENWLLSASMIVITAVLLFWRARVVANRTGRNRWANGLWVGAVTATLSMLFGLCSGFGMMDVIMASLYLAVGTLGGLVARP